MDAVPIETVVALRRETKDNARRILEPYKLDQETLDKYLALAKGSEASVHPQVTQQPSIEPNRRLWLALAHLSGASFRQLGKFHNITSQTVISHVEKILPVEVRASSRVRTRCSHEMVSAMHYQFTQHMTELKQLPLREAAQWLVDNSTVD